MIIQNAKVYTEEKTFTDSEIYIRGDKFSESAGDSEVIDAEGCYAVPGLIDLHFHGCMGYDICDGTREAIEEIAKFEASVGVT